VRKIIISLILLLPIVSFAFGDLSEYFHQTRAGKHELTPSLYMRSEETKFNNGGKDEISTNTLAAGYEYGWLEDVTVGAILGFTINGDYEDTTTSTRGDISGLNNIETFVKARMPAGPGTLHYGAALSLSPSDLEINAYGDVNAATGGHSVFPYVGYEQTSRNRTIGGKLAFEIGLTERTVDDDGTKREVTGGESTVLSFFYEQKFSADILLGAAFDWITTSDTDTKTGITTTTSENISPVQLFRFYLPTKLGVGTLLPEFEYGISLDDKVNNLDVDSYSQMNIKVGYRIEF
jgi:hypothetical protein